MKSFKSLFKKKKKAISKDGISNFDNFQKQCWIYILSFLSFEDLFDSQIASVCKTFYFILEENDRFWNLFVQRNFGNTELPDECKSWKEYFFMKITTTWDVEKSNPNFIIDKQNPTIISTNNYDKGTWIMCRTKNPLMEGYMYPFQIIYPNSPQFPIGVCTDQTDLSSRASFGSDKHRYGYYFGSQVYFCNNSKGKPLSQLKNYIDGSLVIVHIHKGSYAKNSAKVSFFFQEEPTANLEYQMTVTDIDLHDSKLYGYFTTYYDQITVKILPPFRFEDKYMNNTRLLKVKAD